jgi:hypothetical protein
MEETEDRVKIDEKKFDILSVKTPGSVNVVVHIGRIPATQDVVVGGLCPRLAGPGKVSTPPHLKNKLKGQGLEVPFKW